MEKDLQVHVHALRSPEQISSPGGLTSNNYDKVKDNDVRSAIVRVSEVTSFALNNMIILRIRCTIRTAQPCLQETVINPFISIRKPKW